MTSIDQDFRLIMNYHNYTYDQIAQLDNFQEVYNALIHLCEFHLKVYEPGEIYFPYRSILIQRAITAAGKYNICKAMDECLAMVHDPDQVLTVKVEAAIKYEPYLGEEWMMGHESYPEFQQLVHQMRIFRQEQQEQQEQQE